MTLWLFAVLGCGDTPVASEPDPEPVEATAAIVPRAARAAAIAAAIDGGQDPVAAMKAQGLDEESFRALMFKIAADHDLSVQYEQARRE